MIVHSGSGLGLTIINLEPVTTRLNAIQWTVRFRARPLVLTQNTNQDGSKSEARTDHWSNVAVTGGSDQPTPPQRRNWKKAESFVDFLENLHEDEHTRF